MRFIYLFCALLLSLTAQAATSTVGGGSGGGGGGQTNAYTFNNTQFGVISVTNVSIKNGPIITNIDLRGQFFSQAGATITWSNGTPEGLIIAKVGSLYLNTNASAGLTNTAFAKVAGDGLATGWTNMIGTSTGSGSGLTNTFNTAQFTLTGGTNVNFAVTPVITNLTMNGTLNVTNITNSGTLRLGAGGTPGHWMDYNGGYLYQMFNGQARAAWGAGFFSVPGADSTPAALLFYVPSDGLAFMLDNSQTNFNMLTWGNQDAGAPSIKRSGYGFMFRNGTDAAYSGIDVGSITNQSLTGDALIYANTGKKESSVTLATNLTLLSGTLALANTAVTPGLYTNASVVLDAQGRVIAATNGTGGSGSTEVVASAYVNPGDGAINTNGSTYKLFKTFDTNKLALAAIGDSFFDGGSRIFAQLTNLPGWNSLAFYTNSSLAGTSLDTNALTPILALAPRYTGGGSNLVLLISFGANPDFGTSPTLANIATSIANRSNLWKMATNAGIIVFETITTTRTNETAARVIQKKLEGDYIRRAVLTGQINYAADFDKAFSPYIYDYIYSDDGLHPTTVGSQMAARVIDATFRRGMRNWSSYDTTLDWRSVTQTNASTNLVLITENGFTGTRLVTIDKQLGDITTIGKVTGNIQAPLIIQVYGPGTTVTNGTGLFSMSMPQGFICTGVKASVVTPTVSGTISVDVLEGGSTILSTLPVIDQGEYTSATGTQAVVSDPNIAVDSQLSINVSGTYSGAAGLMVSILGYYVQ